MLSSLTTLTLILWSSPSFANPGFPNTLKERDFFIFQGAEKAKPSTPLKASPKDCREHIAQVVCLVDPMTEKGPVEKRPCLKGGERYVETFQTLFDHYPPVMQKVFCSLERLYIERQFFGTGYAGLIHDEQGNTTGAMMGIRQSVIDEKLNLPIWATWKEQLSFGGVLDSYTLTPTLPHILSQSSTSANDFLYFVVAHEFGHILDFANDVNRVKSCKKPEPGQVGGECEMHEESWGALSWITDQRARPENEFENRRRLCFYWCEQSPLSLSDVPQIYRDLNHTSFISLYATTQPWDDFADSLAYVSMAKYLNSSYTIDTRQGEIYDIMARLNSPAFQAKREYLERFLLRTDLKYP